MKTKKKKKYNNNNNNRNRGKMNGILATFFFLNSGKDTSKSLYELVGQDQFQLKLVTLLISRLKEWGWGIGGDGATCMGLASKECATTPKEMESVK